MCRIVTKPRRGVRKQFVHAHVRFKASLAQQYAKAAREGCCVGYLIFFSDFMRTQRTLVPACSVHLTLLFLTLPFLLSVKQNAGDCLHGCVLQTLEPRARTVDSPEPEETLESTDGSACHPHKLHSCQPADSPADQSRRLYCA